MAATKFASTAAKSLAGRAVHLKVNPPPRNLHEDRGVLKVLREFGEVVSYRNLQRGPTNRSANTILAIYQDEEAAARVIKESPLQFTIEEPEPPRPTGLAGLGILQPATDKINFTTGENTGELIGATSKKQARSFYMTADISTADHQSHIQRQKFYWGYHITKRSFSQEDLAKSVPTPGLSSVSPYQTEIPQRIVKSSWDKVSSRKTLRQMFKEGQEARENSSQLGLEQPLDPSKDAT